MSNQCRCWAGSRGRSAKIAVADLVVVVVEGLDGVEVAVDDHVEQPVEQEADTVGGEVGGAVPALEHRLDREPVVLADGDQPPLADEGVDLGLVEAAGLGVDPDRVAGQEQVGGVAVELRALVGPERVLDGELVEAELGGQLVELFLGGAAEVDPHHGVGLLEVIGHVGEREALGVEDTLAIHPRQCITHDVLSGHRSMRLRWQPLWPAGERSG